MPFVARPAVSSVIVLGSNTAGVDSFRSIPNGDSVPLLWIPSFGSPRLEPRSLERDLALLIEPRSASFNEPPRVLGTVLVLVLGVSIEPRSVDDRLVLS